MTDLVLCCTLLLLPLGVLRAALTFFLLARCITSAYVPEVELAAAMAFGGIDLSRFSRPAPLPEHPSAVRAALRTLSLRLRSPPDAEEEDEDR